MPVFHHFLVLVSIILLFHAHISAAFINFFISRQEINRLLGLTTEVSYIRRGKINEWATGFEFRVSENISAMHLYWNATGGASEATYALTTSVEDSSLLLKPSIPKTGNVPLKTENFSIEYRCVGNKKGIVQVKLNWTFMWLEESINLLIRQHKICQPQFNTPLRSSVDGSGEMDEDWMHDYESSMNNEQIFYIALAIVVVTVLIIGSLILLYFKSAKKGQMVAADSARSPPIPNSVAYQSQSRPFIQPESPSTSGKYSAIRTGHSSCLEPIAEKTSWYQPAPTPVSSTNLTPVPIIRDRSAQSIDFNAALNELRADRNCFQFGKVELEGTFGEIRWAIWRLTGQLGTGDVDDRANGEVPMLIKTLKNNADMTQFEKFISESLSFYGLPPHPNLAQVEAAASFGHFDDSLSDLPLICYLHRGFGNLKRLLLRCRGEESASNSGPLPSDALRTQDLVSIGLQIVRGVAHLHRLGILHKDMATRNCLIGKDFTVQICDTALSRDLFPHDYHCLGDNENRPVKWLAIEALDNYEFTSASDVWAFGVTMWELLTCAQQPYPEIDPEEMTTCLKEGTRLPQPYNCPDELFGVIYCCWHHHYSARPSFEQLMVALEDFLTQLMQFI